MGYTTQFKGTLTFTNPLTAESHARLMEILGEDCREHPEWDATELSYIDFELTKDWKGIKWDGSEKSYDMVEKCNLIIDLMKKDFPDFGLTGHLTAQGESVGDVWMLKIVNGVAVEEKFGATNKETIGEIEVVCPNCKHAFRLSEDAVKNESTDDLI